MDTEESNTKEFSTNKNLKSDAESNTKESLINNDKLLMSNILATINKIIDKPTIINKELLINIILKHSLINNIPKTNNTTKEQ